MWRTDSILQLRQDTIKSLVNAASLTPVDADQGDILASIRLGDGDAESVERTTTISPAFGVKGYEASKGSNLLWEFPSEPREVIVSPLRRRLLGHHRSDGLDQSVSVPMPSPAKARTKLRTPGLRISFSREAA